MDLECPEELHEAHNDNPLTLEKKAINPEQMSEYQRRLMADLDLTMQNTDKLVLTLEDKERTWSITRTCSFISYRKCD